MRIIKGISALAIIAALMVGVPAALIILGGNPLPAELPGSMRELGFWLTTGAGADLYISAATIIGWVAWASIAIPILAEIPAGIRGVSRPRLPGLGLQQKLAHGLVGAVIVMITAGGITLPAHADTTTPDDHGGTTTISVAADPTTTDTAAPEQTNDETTSTDDAGQGWVTYTVQAGDSLWSIAAEQLGDGLRWPEIADMNYGREQADGRTLEGGQHWLETGWQLQLPIPTDQATAPAEAETTAGHSTYTVQAGDSLWSIAAEQLGDGHRWEEIQAASAHVDQGHGQQLTDPDTIQPGWTLHIPTTTTAPATEVADTPQSQPAPAPAPEPAVEDATAGDTATGSDSSAADTAEPAAPGQNGAGSPTTQPSVAPQGATADNLTNTVEADDVDEADQAWPVRTLGGAGALLAAGVLALLATRRARSQQHRTPGHRLATPAEPDSLIETRLRAIADPIGLDAVDTALRDLATWHQAESQPLPAVRAARLTTDQFELYLSEPAHLPAPWRGTSDRCIWTIDADRIDQRITTTELGAAPYPSLVTLGHDEEDAHLLLDLEHTEHLDIRGQAQTAHDTLAALAVELATSPWADDLQVTLVGTLPGLADAVDTGRIRHVTGLDAVMRELQARAEHVGQILTDSGADSLSEARGRGVAEDTWTPEILLIGTHLDPHVREQLDELVSRVPRVGIAAVTTDAHTGQWVLDLDEPGTGTLEPAGMRIRPQTLSPTEYDQILSVLATADETVPGPDWATGLADIDEPDLEQVPLTVTIDDIDIELHHADPHDDQDHDHEDQVDTHDVDEAATASPDEAVTTPTEETGADTTPAAATAEVRPLQQPIIRLLGHVDLDGARGTPLPSKETVPALEMLAYLALHPGVDRTRLSADLWPTSEPSKKTRNEAVSRARRWIGTDPATGDNYLPLVGDDGLYRLHPAVTTDWQMMLDLVGSDVTSTSTSQLTRALGLVRSRPFDRERPGQTRIRASRFLWADPYAHEMASTIVDIARETARRALLSGDPDTAENAARTGLTACEDQFHDESLWRYLIRAAWSRSDNDTITHLVGQLHTALEAQDADPEHETVELIDQIRTGTPTTHQPAAI